MHRVQPVIEMIDTYTIVSLESVTVFTLYNEGTNDATMSFGDSKIRLKPGQTISFDAGANTVYNSKVQLHIDFAKKSDPSLTDYVSIVYNRLTKASKIFADAVGSN
jgi:uncharacterized cupredoxin-like copper-binding protein